MANTKILLKKSGVTGNTPSDLIHGELALNYADGVLFYKNSNDVISSISTGSSTDSFATINVGSTLLVASSNNDVLSILAGSGISLDANSTDKSIIISANSYIRANTTDLSTTAPNQTVDSYNKTEYRTVKYLVQAVQGSNVHCTEVVLTHNGIEVFKNEYGTMWTNDSLITVSANIDTDYVYLIVTPTYNNTKIDLMRISIVT